MGSLIKELEEEAISEIVLGVASDATIIWTLGIDDGEALLGRLTYVTEKALMRMAEGRKAQFDHVIRLQGSSLISNKYKRMSWGKVAMAIADELGMQAEKDHFMPMILAEEEEEDDDEDEDEREKKEWQALDPLASCINGTLAGKKYLLVVEHLPHPMRLGHWDRLGLPIPSSWNGCRWLISTRSCDVCKESRSSEDLILVTHEPTLTGRVKRIREDELMTLALHDVASSLSLKTLDSADDDDVFLIEMIRDCLKYCLLFSPIESVGDDEEEQGDDEEQQGDDEEEQALAHGLHQEDLVRYWVADGLITARVHRPEEEEKMDAAPSSLFDTGKALLRELLSRSLLRFHASPSSPSLGVFSTSTIRGFDRLEKLGIWEEEKNDLLKICQNYGWVSFIDNQGVGLRRSASLTTLIIRDCSQVRSFPDDLFQSMPDLRVLDLSYTPLTSLPSSLSCLTNLRLLSLKGCHSLNTLTALLPSASSSPPPSPLQALENLEVLDLNGTLLDHIPDEVGTHKRNLRYLDLSCPNIKSLPPSLFSDMSCLVELLLDGCTALADPLPSMEPMTNLQVLRLTGTQITILPDLAFESMQQLRLLDLSSNHHLISLPKSLFRARGLEELYLQDCKNLRDIEAIGGDKLRIFFLSNIPCLTTLPEWLSKAPGLEKLHIKDCKALKEIKMSGSSSLQSFSLSGSPIIQLTLRACQQLEIIELHDLPYLEVLDLSTTGIKEFPADILKLPRLRRLELLGMKRLRSFPWNEIQRLPKEFILDQCSCDGIGTLDDHGKSIKQHRDADGKTYIRAGDSRLFRTLDYGAAWKLTREKNGLERFHICVSPCGSQVATSKVSQKGSDSSLYKDVYDLTTKVVDAELLRHPCRLDKHVEITNVINRPPIKLRHLLRYAESLFLHDNMFDAPLSHLTDDMRNLEECQIMRCHNMRSIFDTSAASHLEKLWVSDLRRLRVVSRYRGSFFSLTWVHLEHCPRLEKVFPWQLDLPKLKMLTIKFCGTLKAVFYSTYRQSETYLPSLQTICLQDLPHLQHLHENRQVRLPEWKELKIRGCPSLRRLPLLGGDGKEDSIATTSSSPNSHPHASHGPVHVSGELGWWNNLEWDGEERRYCKNHCFQFKPPPPLAEIKYGEKKRPLG